MEIKQIKHSLPVSECRRCGTCCKKGGPSFHLEDKHLIESGKILAKDLYTIRKGETAFDNVKGCLSPVSTDIIKIKGQDKSWTCIFFHEIKGCTIYEKRPSECRALKCWDTKDIELIYSKQRLTRKYLLGNISGLWDLIQEHQARCDYEKIRNIIKKLNSPEKESAQKSFSEILQYDIQIRALITAKGGITTDMTDFLFGRPLVDTAAGLGVNIRKNGEIFCITPRTI